MKVGVITFHSAHNFGASLQTWALQKVLKKNNHEAKVINYHPEVIDDLYDPIKESDPIEREKKIQKLQKTENGRDRLKRYERYTNFIQENFDLVGDCKTYENLEATDFQLDAYITGSDQVWNGDHIGGYDPAYFLEFAPEDAVIMSYSASIGKNYIAPIYQDNYKKALERFDGISIRESSAQPVIEKLTDTPVHVTLDPTLLLDKEDYDEIKSFPDPGEKYILVYMMEYNKEFVNFTNKISKALGLPVIQRRPKTFFKNEIQSCFTCTPGEFLGLVENAEYVLTNSFHGTVFSLIYKKRFISMLHSETGSRTIDLLHAVGEENHLLYDSADFNNFEQFEIKDPAALDERIKDLRKVSLNYLLDTLNIKK